MMKISECLDMMYKIAKLKDIECENCEYSGPPENDGRCPECGAICGVRPNFVRFESPYTDYSRSMAASQYYDSVTRAQQENQAIYSML